MSLFTFRPASLIHLAQFLPVLKLQYNLCIFAKDKLCYYAEECSLASLNALDRPNNKAYAVQMVMLVSAIMLSGVRPSSLLPSKHKPFYLPWRHLEIHVRRGRSGKTVGFDIRLIVANIKGRMIHDANTRSINPIVARFRTVMDRRSLLHDMGSLVLTHAINCGVLPEEHNTPEKLFATKMQRIEVKPEALDAPVFRCGGPRGFELGAGALPRETASSSFRTIIRQSGLAREFRSPYVARTHLTRNINFLSSLSSLDGTSTLSVSCLDQFRGLLRPFDLFVV